MMRAAKLQGVCRHMKPIVLALAASLALAIPALAQDLPDLGGRTIKAVTER